MRKIGLSLVLVGILGATSAVAEENGAFAGLGLGYGGANGKWTATEEMTQGEAVSAKFKNMSSFRYGLLAGYKHFFTPAFGVRAYASFDLGTKYSKDANMAVSDGAGGTMNIKLSPEVNSYNINANVDALYNFITNDALDFGIFGGLSLGYAHHKVDLEVNTGETAEDKMKFDGKLSGFDLGINFGFRANIATNHGVELYSRFGVLQFKDDVSYTDAEDATFSLKAPFELRQPYQVGLRYTFSF